ncbi:MAG: O-antigen ligase family protein, partial [Lachnospiraceae bacterium]|nr:O-antigen ligase family protein [Lachnospiraceae bacterium]
ALRFLPLFFLLILIFPVLTVTLWISDLAVLGSVWRSFEQIGFQAIAILYAVSMAYLFGRKAIDHFFRAMALANGVIILLEIPKYGLMNSLQSMLHCVVTFGDAYGFMRAVEIHDLTFLFGQLFIYYLLFASLDDPENTGRNRSYAAVCLFFVILGFKRLTFPALLVTIIFAWLLLRLKNAWGLLLVLGCIAVFGSFLYIYLIHSGLLIPFLTGKGINLMGRETYWAIANQYFEFSIFWRGLGYESVNALTQSWVEEGLVSKAFPLHNDFLRVYLEIGAIGLGLWSGIQYVLYPLYWAKKYFYRCGVLYFSIFLYMSMTYLTDNTAFYYWSSIGLRLIPMAYCYSGIRAEKAAAWRPSDANEIAASVHAFEAAQLVTEPSGTDD